MRNAFVLNIYEKTIIVQFINIEEHYLITNAKFFGVICGISLFLLVSILCSTEFLTKTSPNLD